MSLPSNHDVTYRDIESRKRKIARYRYLLKVVKRASVDPFGLDCVRRGLTVHDEMHIYCYWFATRRQRIIRKESCVWTTSAHPLTGSFRSGSPSVRPHLSAGSAAGQKLLQCLLKAFLLTEELRISRYTIRSVENGWGLHMPDSTTVVVCLQHQWTKQQLLHGKVTEWLYSVVRCVVFGVFKLYHTSLYVSLTLQRVRGWSARCQCAVNNECGSPGSRARNENVHPCCCIRN